MLAAKAACGAERVKLELLTNMHGSKFALHPKFAVMM